MVDTRWSMYRVRGGHRLMRDAADARAGRTVPVLTEHGLDVVLLAVGQLETAARKNLMPLSGMGLCDAEITAPISTLSTEVRNATPGVGMMPASITSKPPADMPAHSADARNHRTRAYHGRSAHDGGPPAGLP